MSQAWITIKALHWGSASPKIRRLVDPVPLILWPFENSKSKDFDSLQDYYCAQFHVLPLKHFLFIVLTYTPTHIHTNTHCDKVIALSSTTNDAQNVRADTARWKDNDQQNLSKIMIWYRSVYNQTASDAWRYNNPVYKLMTDKLQLVSH